MRKAKYFFFGIAVILLMAQAPTPENLYRALDMHGYCILNTCFSFEGGDTAKIIVPPDTFYFQTNEFHNWSEFMRLVDNHIMIGKEVGIQYDSLKLVERPFISFVFDDGKVCDYDSLMPIFAAQGEVACVAIITDSVGSPGFMTWVQIDSLHALSWEILSHGKYAVDLRTLNKAQLIDQFEISRDVIETHGYQCNNYVYHGLNHNAMVRALVARYYRSARGESGINNPALETFTLREVNIDSCALFSEYLDSVDQAIADKRWLIFTGHCSKMECFADSLDSLINYIQAAGVPILTIDDALDSVGNVIEYGDMYSSTTPVFGVNHQGYPIWHEGFFLKSGAMRAYDITGNDLMAWNTNYWFSYQYPEIGHPSYPFGDGHLDSIKIKDRLKIPLWNNHPGAAGIGTLGLDTAGTDTLWILTEAGWLVVAHD